MLAAGRCDERNQFRYEIRWRSTGDCLSCRRLRNQFANLACPRRGCGCRISRSFGGKRDARVLLWRGRDCHFIIRRSDSGLVPLVVSDPCGIISCNSGVTVMIVLSGGSPRQHRVFRRSTAPIGPPPMLPRRRQCLSKITQTGGAKSSDIMVKLMRRSGTR
jgi:hypothetical protein